MKLFTYGSLMRGHYNHYILKHEKFLRESTIQGNYVLFTMPGSEFPRLVDISLSTVFHPLLNPNIIHGEVYEVSDETMKRIDRMEFTCGYERITVKDSNDEVNVYFLKERENCIQPVETIVIIQSGYWTEYIKRFKPELYNEAELEIETVSLS